MGPEAFPGANRQRCVKCESAAACSLGRRIEDGRWAILVHCLNPECRYSRELDIDPESLTLDSKEKWQ